MRLTQSPPARVSELRESIVQLAADAMRAGDFSEHPGRLGAHGGPAVVDEPANEGHRGLLAPYWHPSELQGPVIL